jgi:hypothetical protein
VNISITQTQNGITGTWKTMIFNGPRGSVSATLVGSQLLNFTLNGFAPCAGVLSGSATVDINTRRIQSTYTGSDCQGTHSNGRSDISPGTRPLYDFSGAWQEFSSGLAGLYFYKIRQSGSQLFISEIGTGSSQGTFCFARSEATATTDSEVFGGSVTSSQARPVGEGITWAPDLSRIRAARVTTGVFVREFRLVGNPPPGCDP